MVDHLSQERRSWNMSRIKARDTKPERKVRSLLHRMGFRFTVSGPRNQKLPGKPDIVLPKHRAVVFVHGCFWHRHPGCRFAYTPKSNVKKWTAKFSENVDRDKRQMKELEEMDWNVVIVWECELRDLSKLEKRLADLLAGDRDEAK